MQQPTSVHSPIDEDAPTIVLRKRSRSAARAMTSFVLAVLDGRHKGEVLRLGRGENLIGRSLSAEVRLGDDGISRRHATVRVDDEHRIIVVDLGSTNGTYVNGRQIENARVHPGDRIRVGTHALLEFRTETRDETHSDRATRQIEPDAPILRRKHNGTPGVSFLSKLYGIDAHAASAVPCWGYSSEAIRAYERLLRIRKKKLGARHLAVAEILEILGAALQDNLRFDRALECYDEAYRIYAGKDQDMKARAARALVRRARCEVSLVRNRAALTSFERAEAMLLEGKASEHEIACVRLSIARVLWVMKEELQRGRRLAREAESLFDAGGPATTALREEANKYARLIEMALAREELPNATTVQAPCEYPRLVT